MTKTQHSEIKLQGSWKGADTALQEKMELYDRILGRANEDMDFRDRLIEDPNDTTNDEFGVSISEAFEYTKRMQATCIRAFRMSMGTW